MNVDLKAILDTVDNVEFNGTSIVQIDIEDLKERIIEWAEQNGLETKYDVQD